MLLHQTSSRLRITAVAAAALLLAAPVARAQKGAPQKGAPTADELAKGKEHFARGKKLFEKKNFKGAVQEFKESFRLTRNPLLLYNIGYTFDQLNEKPLALFYYQKYLEQAPASDGNRQAAEGRVQVLEIEIEEAKVAGGGSGPATGPEPKTRGSESAPPSPGPAVDKFQHVGIDEAPPGKPIDVSAFIPQGRNWTVTLFYRAAGEGSFTPVEMKPRYNELVGRIPAAKTVGQSVQYYIEVKDAGGKVVDRSGKQTSPHLVLLDRSAKARYYADMGEESAQPLASEEAVAAGGGMAEAESADQPRGDGWMDAGSSRFSKLKWGATGAAAGLLALSTTFYLLSSKASSDLETEAQSSTDPALCGGTVPPCRTFSEKQQSLEGKGQRFETFANISLAVGGAAAIGAGVLWYLEIRDARKRRRAREETASPDEPKLSAVPVIGEDFVGGAAAVRF
jgi:tetratricopeptide (TPR) repeat protein